jgi:phosphonoacetaldehyde hydrolase
MEAFRQADVPITSDQARGPMGMAKRDHLSALLQLDDVRQRWQQVHGRPPTDGDVDHLYEQFIPLQKTVLSRHAELIPGCLETVEVCRRRGMAIGSSTGYVQELMEILVPLAREQCYEPDAIVCASDVSPGRPAPWMCFENARRLGVFPMQGVVKVDDTTVGIEAGLNAGMWTVGVARSGNLVGLAADELAALETEDRQSRVESARKQLYRSGAHCVVDTIADLPAVLDAISERLSRGERP